MQVIAVATIAALSAVLAGKYKSHYSRMLIGGVFGILFFAVAPFLTYAADLLQWPDLYRKAVFLSLSVLAVAISLLLLKIKDAEIVGVASVIAFFVLIFVSRGFEIEFKQAIDRCCYFNEMPAANKNQPMTLRDTQAFIHASGGYSMNLPGDWNRKNDLGEMFIYFQKVVNDEVVVELRPMCLDKREITLGQVVMNIRDLSTHEKGMPEFACYKTADNDDACAVSYRDSKGQITKITRFGFGKDDDGYSMDFIINKKDDSLEREIEAIIGSIRYSPQQSDLSPCTSLAEWF